MTEIEQDIIKALLIFLACWENWMCFRLIYAIVLGGQDLRRWQNRAVYILILMCGVVIGLNREVLYFSYPIPIMIALIFGAGVWGITRRRLMLIWVISGSFFISVAFIDYILAFIMASYNRNVFGEIIYFHTTFWRIGILFCGRFIALIVVIKIQKWTEKNEFAIKGLYGILFFHVCIGCVLLKIYQFKLQELAIGISRQDGIAWGFSLLFVLTLFGVFWIVWIRGRMLQQENEFLKQKEMMLGAYYREIKENQEQNKQLVHDMKNHLIVLKVYQEENDLVAIGKYLDCITAQFRNGKVEVWTGNQVVDIVLNQKREVARQKNIRVELEVEVAESWFLSDNESCSVFGNLLDNAIEACERVEKKERWIRIIIRGRECILLAEISNSIEKRPKVMRGKFLTEKKGDLHGIGLESVRRVVDRYHGCLEYKIDENQFLVNLVMYAE